MSGSKVSKVVLLFLVAGGAYWGWTKFSGSGAANKNVGNLGVVTKADIVQRVTMTGTIKSKKALLIRAPYKGFVRKIYVKVGDVVKVGEPLISIAQSTDQPDSEVYPMRSTMPGVVTQIQNSEGESVNESTSEEGYILRVDDLSQYYVSCDVPEIDVVKLKQKQKAIVRASAVNDQQFEGEIITLSLAAAVQERWNRGIVQYRVDVGIKGEKLNFRPGMTAMVDVIADERRDVLTVNQEFVEPEGDKFFVTLANGTRQQIKVGLQDETSFEILEGLKEGDQVKQVDFVATAAGASGPGRGRRKR